MPRRAVVLATIGLLAIGCDGGITVRGHVYGPDGAPLMGATASLAESSGMRHFQGRQSDPMGCFTFHVTVAPGHDEFRLLVRHDGYKPASVAVFSGQKVNEVEVRMVGSTSRGESTSSASERALLPDETSHFDVRCNQNAAGAKR